MTNVLFCPSSPSRPWLFGVELCRSLTSLYISLSYNGLSWLWRTITEYSLFSLLHLRVSCPCPHTSHSFKTSPSSFSTLPAFHPPSISKTLYQSRPDDLSFSHGQSCLSTLAFKNSHWSTLILCSITTFLLDCLNEIQQETQTQPETLWSHQVSGQLSSTTSSAFH